MSRSAQASDLRSGSQDFHVIGGFRHAMKRILGSSDLKRLLPFIGLTAFFANILALALPLAILQIFDRVLRDKSYETLLFLTAGVVIALILEELLKAVNGTVTNWLGARFKHKMGMTALQRFFQVPMRIYTSDEPGAYAEKMQSVSKVADFYSGQALLVLFDLPFVLIFLSIIYLIGGPLVFVPLSLLCIFLIAIIFYGRWMRDQVTQRDINEDRRISFLTEVLAGILSVKTMVLEALMLRRYERLKEASATQGETLTYGSAFANGLGVIFSQVMIVLVIFYGAVLVIDGDITPGSLAACMMLSVRSLQPLRRGLATWMRYQSFIAAENRLSDIMELPFRDEEGLEELPPIKQGLQLKDVTVAFDGEIPLFTELSLDIPAGSCIAIRGDSGSGKTTLLSLLSGMEEASQGEVLIDGHSIKGYSSDSLHHRIALLPQSGTVVAGTILENLTMYDPSLQEKAIELSQKLGLDEIVAGMRQGYETAIGEDAGEALPMGVKQMITLVRTLVHEPDVILFDEANISLDLDEDRYLRWYLEKLKGQRTFVLVTHRPSLVKLADQVYDLANGQLTLAKSSDSGAFFGGNSSASWQDHPGYAEEFEDVIGTRTFSESDFSRCLMPLLQALGWGGAPRRLAEALPHLVDHLDLSYLFSTLANLGYQARRLNIVQGDIDSRLLPCLYVPENAAALVVLERSEDGLFTVFDSRSQTEMLVSRLPKKGQIYVFQELENIEKGRPQNWLRGVFWKFRKHMLLAFFITLLSTSLSIAPPLFVRAIFDSVLPAADVKIGLYLLAGVFLAIILAAVLNGLRSRLLAFVGGRLEYILGYSIFERVIGLPVAMAKGLSVSRQVGRVKNLERLREFFVGPLALITLDIPASCILLLALMLINPWGSLVLLVAMVVFVLMIYIARRLGELSSEDANYSAGKRTEFIDESLTAMRAIRAVGASKTWLDRYRDLSGRAVMNGFKEQQTQLKVGSVAQFVGGVTGISMLSLSAALAIQGQITGGTLMATMILTWRLVGPMQNLFFALNGWAGINSNMKQINNLMRLNSEHDRTEAVSSQSTSLGQVSFSRVSFRYASNADPAILGASFDLMPGQVMAIAGPDGAGKSTLLKLLTRVYVPQAGTIRLEHIDTRQLTVANLRSRISYMPQKFDLFYGTVAQNLRLVHPAATDEELRWAAEMAGILKDIEQLERGFETRISNSRSDLLPNGFRQRLSLARTVLKPASVVLMDEPGTGMDNAGEDALVRCIDWLRGRVTLVIVSHRPSHLKLADTILYLESGSVTARGAFSDVEEKVMAGLR